MSDLSGFLFIPPSLTTALGLAHGQQPNLSSNHACNSVCPAQVAPERDGLGCIKRPLLNKIVNVNI